MQVWKTTTARRENSIVRQALAGFRRQSSSAVWKARTAQRSVIQASSLEECGAGDAAGKAIELDQVVDQVQGGRTASSSQSVETGHRTRRV